MDLLLQRFVENHYHNLSEYEQQLFNQLLDEADLDIMDWVLQRCEPPPAFSMLIEKIRDDYYPVRPEIN